MRAAAGQPVSSLGPRVVVAPTCPHRFTQAQNTSTRSSSDAADVPPGRLLSSIMAQVVVVKHRYSFHFSGSGVAQWKGITPTSLPPSPTIHPGHHHPSSPSSTSPPSPPIIPIPSISQTYPVPEKFESLPPLTTAPSPRARQEVTVKKFVRSFVIDPHHHPTPPPSPPPLNQSHPHRLLRARSTLAHDPRFNLVGLAAPAACCLLPASRDPILPLSPS